MTLAACSVSGSSSKSTPLTDKITSPAFNSVFAAAPLGDMLVTTRKFPNFVFRVAILMPTRSEGCFFLKVTSIVLFLPSMGVSYASSAELLGGRKWALSDALELVSLEYILLP